MNNFAYIPSISAGPIMYSNRDNTKLFENTNPLSTRIYSLDYDGRFRHPYYLVTAGHHYKNLEFREKFGLMDSFVFGDSGGFQIKNGNVKFSNELLRGTFNFLELNADVAANLDIPPTNGDATEFNRCLELSISNFKYFANNQTGKTKFLNVLQGFGEYQINSWYNSVKQFNDFSGWALGNVNTVSNIVYKLALLLKSGEFSKAKYLHFFGLSGVFHFILALKIQQCFNKHGYDISVTTDSSSPNMYAKFGQYLIGPNYSKASWESMSIPKHPDVDYANNYNSLPCSINCPICQRSTFSSYDQYSSVQSKYIVIHNIHLMTSTVEQLNRLINSPSECLKSVLSSNLIRLLESIDELFVSDSISVYHKYKVLYERINPNSDNLINHLNEKYF